MTTSSAKAPAHAVAASERLLSLDVFRGATIAAMLVVNNPGTWGAVYPPLLHAEWHGWTPTDLIFPFFLFIVGVTTHLSLTARRARGDADATLVRQVLRRGGLIFFWGFVLSAFPFFATGQLPGNADPSFLDRIAWRFEHVRYLGVLQRIGIAYVAAALLSFRTSLKQQVAILAALLFGYWLAMTLIPIPGHGIGALLLDSPGDNLAAHLDRWILGLDHIWSGSRIFDPEGPLSTIPAVGTAMFGVMAGRWIGSGKPLGERIEGLFGAGFLATVLGLAWGWVFPINKSLWTSSYALFTAGAAALTLAASMWVIDRQRVTWWTTPLKVFGVNPLVAFVGSGLMARLIYSLLTVRVGGETVSVQAAVFNALFASWREPRDASLLFALAFTGSWLAVLWVLYRKGIFIRV
jgi:predicted acyltransferase